jgi:BCD family chlorophyll transporter-like MFS transporter
MTIFRNIRLGLLHIAVAITFVLINGVLNRVMIYNLGILASVVAALAILPYALSPLQMWIGQYSDTHPIFGLRRTPYIALGIALCLFGTVLTPYAAFSMAPEGRGGLSLPGVLLGVIAFSMWGFGYNLAVVSYLSLASDLSNESNRARTVAIMWFMMITSLIVTAILVGRAMEPYSDAQLIRVFWIACGVALGIAALGLIGLEPRLNGRDDRPAQSRVSQRAAIQAVGRNPQAQLFFVYLTLMLAAILGQDVLLEPYGAQQFGMTVRQTTQLTATWGGATLAALLLYGLLLNRWMSKKTGAAIGGVIATLGLILIAFSGLFNVQAMFVPGVAVLGFGTGIATSTNLALMLDMTTAEQAGLFIGAWGIADALARGTGMLLGGVMRDVVTGLTGNPSSGYITVFLIEAGLLACSLLLLRSINVHAFREQPQPRLTQLVAFAGDV